MPTLAEMATDMRRYFPAQPDRYAFDATKQYAALQATRNPRPHKKGATIMRIQPMTLLHEELIEGGLKTCDKFLLVIGSAFEATSLKNPWSYEERRAMVEFRFKREIEEGRLLIAPLTDYTYRPIKWYGEFNKLVCATLQAKLGDFVLYTYGKDAATKEYISEFDKRIPVVQHPSSNPNVDATQVRMDLFRGVPAMNIQHISGDVAIRLHVYKANPDYARFTAELEAIDAYRLQWSELKDENGKTIRCPFPSQFMAVDAVVTWKDRWGKPYFLVIKRKSDFGNGKLAIPGGFLDQNETALVGAKRELLEETTLAVDDSFVLDQVRVYDDPGRSMRGRMVTFAHVWKVCSHTMPVVKGMDDAAEAFWLPIDEIAKRKRDFFSDHYYILSHLYPSIEDEY